MAGFWGMDTEQVSGHSERMRNGAATIDDLCTMMSRQVASVAWVGPDADAFRHDAAEQVRLLGTWTEKCTAAATQLGDDVDQQNSASAPDGSGIAAVAAGIVGASDIGALLGAAPGTVPFPGAALSDLAASLGDSLGTHDDPTDDIAVIEAKDVTRPDADDVTNPESIEDLLKNLEAAGQLQDSDATSIRVQEVVGADGETRYIVYVPGSYGPPSHLVGPDRGGNPMDWNQNPGALLGNETDSSQAVIAAMKAAGIPPGSDVAMVGHSQGGIVASNLAADPAVNGGPDGWNVTDLVTVGSPVELAHVPPGTSTLNLDHEPVRPDLPPGLADVSGPFRSPPSHGSSDIVPGLDGDPHEIGNSPAHRHEVGLPAPSANPVENHEVERYRESVEDAKAVRGGEAGDRIRGFEYGPTMSRYLRDREVTDTVDVPVSREPGTFRP